jgi:hypothetical protein
LPPLSRTETVKLKGPPTVGVPVIAPDDVLNESPFGNAPALIE